MTRRGCPRSGLDAAVGTDWMDGAACRCGDPAWTGERKPAVVVYDRLAAVCAGCPVRYDCAAHALVTDAQAGMYAGVWLPVLGGYGRATKAWLAAREHLHQVLIEEAAHAAV